MLESHQLTEWEALQAARQQIARADAVRTELMSEPTWELPNHPATHPFATQLPDITVAAALRSDDALARMAAQQSLANIALTLKTVTDRKQQVDAMMTQLLRETREVRRREHRRIASKIAIGLIVIMLLFWGFGHTIFNFWWVFLGGGGAIAADERVGKRREAVQVLYKAGEPRAVGVLAIAMRDGDYSVQRVAEQALRDLLPRVRASDAAYIDHEQMTALLALVEQDNSHMQTALLKALEQIGDERAIPIVEYLARSGQTTLLRRQASECLPFLTERVRLAREQSTLLRGTSPPTLTTASAQLLRPASGAETTPAEQLLRPTEDSKS